MSRAASSPAAYSEQTQVFALAAKTKRFVSLVELSTARQWVYAFTSVDKAKAFVRIMRQVPGFPEVERVLPCTLGEWFAWQPKKNLPDLAIDPDPATIAHYPLGLAADAAKFDIQCLTQRLPTGLVHRVSVTPRPNPPSPELPRPAPDASPRVCRRISAAFPGRFRTKLPKISDANCRPFPAPVAPAFAATLAGDLPDASGGRLRPVLGRRPTLRSAQGVRCRALIGKHAMCFPHPSADAGGRDANAACC